MCNSDPMCIAAHVRYPEINMVLEENVTYVCFNFYGTGIGFTTACGMDNYNEGCYKKACLNVTTTMTTCTKEASDLRAALGKKRTEVVDTLNHAIGLLERPTSMMELKNANSIAHALAVLVAPLMYIG